MMKRTGKVVAVMAFAAIAVGMAFAQPSHRGPKNIDPKMAQAHKELRESLMTWGRANVLPQLRTWKGQLDGAMSADDLRTLNDLRARATALRKEKAALAAEFGKGRRDGENKTDEARKAHREQKEALRSRHKAIAEELKPLAEKYQSTLETIGQDARPKIEGWKEEAKAIVVKWFEQHKSELGDRKPGHMMRHGMGMFGGFKGKGRIVARFMLWDGGDFSEEMEQMDGGSPELR